jgi:pseudouridine-5'-phosphate glycosidase
VPVVGFRTDIFPAFYLRESRAAVDARFDDPADLAGFVDRELRRTGRGIVVANPIPATAAITTGEWDRWIREAEHRAGADGARGRDVTPRILRRLHEVSGGATLRANIALVRANAALAAQVCAAMARL